MISSAPWDRQTRGPFVPRRTPGTSSGCGPVPGDQGPNTLRASLHLLARTSDGDPDVATMRWSPFGPVNGAGGRAEELIFASLAPETVSLRV